MKIRFLQNSPSSNPEFPFQAGQIITTPSLTAEMRAALDAGTAEVLAEEPELAMQGPATEAAVQKRGRPRGSR